MIPTIPYDSEHTQHEHPEEECSCEPQEYHKQPAEEHGDSQATRGKSTWWTEGPSVLNVT